MSHTVAGGPGAGTDTWVRSAFDLLSGVPGVRRVGLALVEGGGRRLSFTASDRGHQGHPDWCQVDAYEDVPLNNTVRTGRLIIGSLEELARRYPEFVAGQASTTRALASVPLVAAGQVLGGFVLFYTTSPRFSERELGELQRLGEELGADLRWSQRTMVLPHRSVADEPAPVGALVSGHVVAPDPRGVAPARDFVRSTLAAWGVNEDPVEVAVLCASELVTNAIIHTVAGCEVRLMLHRGVLTLSVRDGGTDPRGAPPSTDDPRAGHGRGLQLVESAAARWGSQLDADGMTVWCELDVT